MANSELLIERYELKYRLTPEVAHRVRQAIQPYVRPDSASARGPYLISSLYLDTPRFDFYTQTRNETPRRFKLRIRRYTTGPYFIECKRRIKDVISKIRVAVPADAFPAVILSPSGLDIARTDRDRRNLEEFIRRMRTWGAEPTCVVRYSREAFVSEVDDYGRVTFDWQLCGRPAEGWHVPMHEPGWTPVDGGIRFGMPFSGVVLELKCTTAVPLWMSDLVRRFGLMRTGFSKFCSTMEATVPGVKDPGGLRVPAPWLLRSPV